MIELGPGAAPYNREEARAISRGIVERGETALGPYLVRASQAQMAARDEGREFDAMAERMGVSREELDEHVDAEGSVYFSAMFELIADVMHQCEMRDISWPDIVASAGQIYHRQTRAMKKLMIYGTPDRERPDDGLELRVWGI